MWKNFFWITMVIFVWFGMAKNIIAQTKLYDLSHDGLSVDFSPDGEYIVTGDAGGDVELWEVSTGERIYRRSIGGTIKGVAFNPDGKFIAAGGAAVVVRLRTSDGKEVQRLNFSDARGINAVAYSTDDIHVAIGDDTGAVYLWDVNKVQVSGWKYKEVDNLYAVTFSPDGEYIATGDSAGYARIWEVDSWWESVKIQNIELGGNVRSLTFSPNGRYLAADQYDGPAESVYIYDVVQNRDVRQIDQGSTTGRGVTALAFSPDSRYIAVGNVNSEIKIYRIGTEIIASVTLITHEMTIQTSGSVEDLAWGPDSNLISDGKSVWQTDQSVPDNTPEIRLTLPDDFISEVVFGPNSTYFVLNAQYPTLMKGNKPANVVYGKCTITLDFDHTQKNTLNLTGVFVVALEYIRQVVRLNRIPTLTGLTNHLVSEGLLLIRPGFPDQAPYFMFPLLTLAERLIILEEEINNRHLGALFSTVVGLIPGLSELGAIPGLVAGVTLTEWERLRRIDEIFRSGLDPKIILSPSIGDQISDFFTGATPPPEDKLRYLFYIPDRRVSNIRVKVEQKYKEGTSLPPKTARYDRRLNLANNTWASPSMQPMSLVDYPPFQQLSPEGQEYLFRRFGEFMSAWGWESWRIPEKTSLLPNYPNPFNPETWIPYQLATAADVSIDIYAADGQLVRSLDLGHQPIGIYENKSRAAYWDGKNASGEPVASGVYFYTLTAGEFTATRKMLIRK